MKQRLDNYLVKHQLVSSRSQAANLIGLGKVRVNNKIAEKSGQIVSDTDKIIVHETERYVSRAAYKLDSVVQKLGVSFDDKVVLDVGSSTGGFTDYALQNGAARIIAVDVGSEQLHPSLRGDKRIELHEKTDIRNFTTTTQIDIVLVDVSFISVTKILSRIIMLATPETEILIMAKPQFEADNSRDLHRGVVKNNRVRRDIFRQFEQYIERYCKIIASADSSVAGVKGNVERFYLLKKLTE